MYIPYQFNILLRALLPNAMEPNERPKLWIGVDSSQILGKVNEARIQALCIKNGTQKTNNDRGVVHIRGRHVKADQLMTK